MNKNEVGARLARPHRRRDQGCGMKSESSAWPMPAICPCTAYALQSGSAGLDLLAGSGSADRASARARDGGALRHRHRTAAWRGGRRSGPAPGCAQSGVTCLNAPGTIDSDYRGEIKAILINHSDKPFKIARGTKIAQMVIARHEQAERWKARRCPTACAAPAASGPPA